MRTYRRIAVALLAGLSLTSSALAQKSHQYDNTTPITIGDNTSATPYQTSVSVSGVTGPIGTVKVAVHGLTHSFPRDIGMLLVGPGGQSVALMGRVGGFGPGTSGAEYLFTQDGNPLSTSSANSPSGRYRPTIDGTYSLTFAAPAPAGPYGANLDVFKGLPANGTWSLFVNDEQGQDAGSMTGWSLILEEAPSIANGTPIAIPASGTIGTASIYPTTAIVDGLEGHVRSVRVMLTGLIHSYQEDLRVMLQGPQGQTCLLYSECGGGAPGWAAADLIFDDNAATLVPDGTLASPGTYKPTVCAGASGSLPAPAPAAPYGTTLSTFNGTNPNGVWRLWIQDAFNGDSGTLAGGWSLIINGQTCPADFNKNGGLEIQDIFDFLSAWFAGCP